MRDGPKAGELVTAIDYCKKNSHSVFSCIGKRTKEKVVTMVTKTGQFISNKT